jgi:hypothetical protein
VIVKPFLAKHTTVPMAGFRTHERSIPHRPKDYVCGSLISIVRLFL